MHEYCIPLILRNLIYLVMVVIINYLILILLISISLIGVYYTLIDPVENKSLYFIISFITILYSCFGGVWLLASIIYLWDDYRKNYPRYDSDFKLFSIFYNTVMLFRYIEICLDLIINDNKGKIEIMKDINGTSEKHTKHLRLAFGLNGDNNKYLIFLRSKEKANVKN